MDYTIRTLERRLQTGDPWADFWKQLQRLPEPAEASRHGGPAGRYG